MSLWTPSGERPVGEKRPPSGDPATSAPDGAPAAADGVAAAGTGAGSADEVETLRRQLAEAPPEVVIANHCYGLFELAAVYLSQSPPRLEQARLAIDALGALIEGLVGRLGEADAPLRDALAQVRLAFVQIQAAAGTGAGPA